MSFHEIRLDDGLVSYDADGGAGFSTEIVRTFNGAESRNQNWAESLAKFDWGDMRCTRAELDRRKTFLRARKGRLHGFRVKDWGDYRVVAASGTDVPQGRVGLTAIGTGLPTYDLYARYADAAASDDKRIWKPLATGFALQRNGAAATLGGGAGNYSLDTVNGRATFVADASSGATSVTVGATTQVVLTTNPGTLVAGKLLYLAGFTGADAALLNGQAHTINSVSGTGPYTFVLATNTAGKTITLGAGNGYKYPQPSDTLTWSGEFDLPCRFDTDEIRYRFVAMDPVTGEMLFDLQSMPIVELRTP